MFLIANFRQFYGEVLRLKSRIAEGTWVFEGDAAAAAARNAIDVSPSAVWRRLLSLLERQALEAGREGGDFAVEIYRRAQYAMAALADEVFLHLDWAGRDAWRGHLLESKLFGTHRAGEEVFERMEELLRDRDSLYSELARVYLMVLALGFQGKYRGRPDVAEEIASYRKRLFRFVYGRDPVAIRNGEHLVESAYHSTLDHAKATELPYLKRWLWSIAAIVALWLGASHLVWRAEVAELSPYVDELLGDGVTQTRASKRAAPPVQTTTVAPVTQEVVTPVTEGAVPPATMTIEPLTTTAPVPVPVPVPVPAPAPTRRRAPDVAPHRGTTTTNGGGIL